MSASSKKKLRKEQNAAAMTERQKKEQQEAKKLKAYTLTFAIVMVLVVAIVVGVIVSPMIDGLVRRNSNAVTIGEHKLSTADLTYFYFDAISEYQQTVYNQYYSSFGNYWSYMLGFDTTKPLNEQMYDEKEGKTWADHFIDTAIDTAKDTYALYDDAVAKGHTFTEEEQANLDSYLESMELYATYYGYSSVKSYLRSNYGNGATEKNYNEYYRVCSLASSYLSKYHEDLEYDLEDYRAYEKDKFDDYSTLSYIYYSMKYNTYLGEGTKSEDGKTTTWTDEEKNAARDAMKADLEALLAGEVKDKESFDKAIQAWEINKPKEEDNKESDSSSSSSSSSSTATKLPTSTEVKDAFINSISLQESAVNWLKETKTVDGKVQTARVAGELKAFEVYTYEDKKDLPDDHKHGDDCGCSRTIDGYTIVLFTERDDNEVKMANVRHILVKFQGGTKDKDGNVTYSDEEKKTAKEEAEKLLKQWQEGKADEESFGELANKESDDQNGKVTNGGLYEDIYPGQMVKAFEEWCFAEGRKTGDTGIVETEYGYHVMFYSSTDEMSYRDLMIDTDLRAEDTEKWHDSLSEKVTCVTENLKYMDYDYVLQEQ